MAHNTIILEKKDEKNKETKELPEGTSEATINQRKLERGHLLKLRLNLITY